MAIRSLKTGVFSRSLLVGNETYLPGDFVSIATVTVGSGGQASIAFNSIPSDYQHLQLRGVVRGGSEVAVVAALNGTGGNGHTLYSNGSIRGAFQESGIIPICVTPDSGNNSNIFGAFVCDILDYSNTNKNKVTRSLHGTDRNSSGNPYIMFSSGLWQSTSAVNSIVLTVNGGASFVQNSRVALYGIKG
jgi:hypothetical protein